jgi:glutamine synthetase
MLGSTVSIAEPNIMLNTAVADVLAQFADSLEKSRDFIADVAALIKKTIKEHKRIIFNGNGYDDAWVAEAQKRGLSNLKTTPEALAALLTDKNVSLFTRHSVFTEQELVSRHEIFLENYSKTINIEALTMLDLVNREVIPAVLAYQSDLAELAGKKKALGGAFGTSLEENLLLKLSKLSVCLEKRLEELSVQTVEVHGIEDSVESAAAYREKVFTAMSELRLVVDELEMLVSSKYWTLPTYGEILYSVV